MKQNEHPAIGNSIDKCKTALCSNCENCRAGKHTGSGLQGRSESFQLYATEAEHYFFYFTPVTEKAGK